MLVQHYYPNNSLTGILKVINVYGGTDKDSDLVPKLMLTSFNESSAQLETIHLEGWSSLNKKFCNVQTVRQIAQKTANEVGLKEIFDFSVIEEKNFHAVSWEGMVDPNTCLYFSVQSMAGTVYGDETYLLIGLEGNAKHNYKQMMYWHRQIRSVFKSWQAEPRISYCLIGTIKGKLSSTEKREEATKILAALEAERIEGVDEGDYLSISAYSSKIPDYLEVGEKKVNVNVALRYHSTDDKTYLHLGSPLLGGEY